MPDMLMKSSKPIASTVSTISTVPSTEAIGSMTGTVSRFFCIEAIPRLRTGTGTGGNGAGLYAGELSTSIIALHCVYCIVYTQSIGCLLLTFTDAFMCVCILLYCVSGYFSRGL